MDNLHIIALGGSIMMPDQIDTDFLIDFKQFLEKFVNRGDRFIIVSGGGRLARNYQEAAHQIAQLSATPPLPPQDLSHLIIISVQGLHKRVTLTCGDGGAEGSSVSLLTFGCAMQVGETCADAAPR